MYTENWSAFEPGFKELEENEEYIEREDEFDEIDEPPRQLKRQSSYQEEDGEQEIDIISSEKYFSDEDENELLFLPLQIKRE